jgi:hypothetical protein
MIKSMESENFWKYMEYESRLDKLHYGSFFQRHIKYPVMRKVLKNRMLNLKDSIRDEVVLLCQN